MNSATQSYIRAHPEETTAGIVAALAEDFSTAQNIDRKALAAHLLASGLSRRFRAARANEEIPAPMRGGLEELQEIVTSGIDYIETTNPAHGESMTQLLGGLQMVGLVDTEETAAFLALAGGYRYDRGLTEEQVDAYRSFLALEVEEVVLTAQIEEGRQRVEQAMNALRTALQEEQTDVPAPTWAELAAAFAGEG